MNYINTIKKLFAAIFITATLASSGSVLLATPVGASGVDVIEQSCRGPQSSSALCDDGDAPLFGNGSVFQKITNALLFLTGAIAVVMIVVGGFRYTTSAGNQAAVTSAKNTIIYAVIGLVVALFGYAIVNFVIGAF